MPDAPAPELSPEIRLARRLVESTQNVALLADLRWFAANSRWGFKCRITLAAASQYVPAETDWWVVLEPNYPWGDIRFYPALTDSITATFPHQKFNGFEREEWRSGELCLRSPLFSLGRTGYDVDPVGDANRLAWHFERAKKWLHDAAHETLLAPGDAFELLSFPPAAEAPLTIANFEDERTFAKWSETTERFGTVEIIEINSHIKTTLVASRFLTPKGDVVAYPLGSYLNTGDPAKQIGLWVRLEAMPIIAPFQAPRTWGELRQAAPELSDLLQHASGAIRDGMPHLLLIGFPIPLVVGGPPRQMHWQPVQLPTLSHGEQHAPGFRPRTALGYWHRDLTEGLRSSEYINWQVAENWSDQQANARGRYCSNLAEQKVAIIGAGAIGSHVAELLVRGGVDDSLVIDNELLAYGNLCRHTLSLSTLDRSKAHALMVRLSAARGTVKADSLYATFPDLGEEGQAKLKERSLIVDCTGSDEVLNELELYPWERERSFCSISVGYHAKRIYVYSARGLTMPAADFRAKVLPWLEKDIEDFGAVEPGRESVGCWHISYPARVDQIVMAAVMAVRCLDEWAKGDFAGAGLRVFEQGPNGVTEVTDPST